MEPSTPPRNLRVREVPPTPATPRFGSFEDLDAPRKPRRTPAPATPSKHRRKRSATLATPRQTPRKRALRHTSERIDECSEDRTESNDRTDERSEETEEFTIKSNPLDDIHNTNAAGPSTPVNSTNAAQPAHKSQVPHRLQSAATADKRELLHPHQDHPPPDVPGMWYVFRGKRIFRPLPPGEKHLEPVTLFQDILADAEEADTDLE